MMASKVRVIINPRAGSGKAGRKLFAIERAFRRHGLSPELVQTRAPGDATRLMSQAARDGIDIVAVVGGDGTINEVSRASLHEDGELVSNIPDLALIPAGTGGDLRKTFGISSDVDEAVRKIARSRRKPLDLGALEIVDHEGLAQTSTFLNVASFGISGLTDRLVNEAPKWMGGTLAFLLGSLRASLAYRNAPVRVRVDGRPFLEGRVFLVAIANGRYFGGGMKIAPHADPSDGRFEVIAIGDIGKFEAFGLATKIYRGAHLEMAKTTLGRGSIIEAEPLDGADVLLDVDGETPGRLPLRAKILPAALGIRL